MKELFIIIVIIAVTSFFVLSEIAIVTARRIKLQKLSNRGSSGAARALHLKEKPEVFLSTVQVGITLMSIIIGFYSGSGLSECVAGKLKDIPQLEPYANNIADAFVVILITYFTVLGEIVPKRIAMLYPEEAARYISGVMQLCVKLFYPFIFLLSASTKLILSILSIKDKPSELTTEEVKMLIAQAEMEGAVEKTEMHMIRRLIHLSDIKVGAIMTPRQQMVYLDLNDPDKENAKKVSQHTYSHFPVIEGDLSNFVGLISIKQLFHRKVTNELLRSLAMEREVVYIPEVARLTHLLELLRYRQLRVAIVLDEYGDIEGIVTLNDILKTFVGDFVAHGPGQAPSIIQNKNGALDVSGNVPIEEIMELLDLESLPGEKEEDYRTISSFILKQMNRMPQVGDEFEAVGYNFSISKMDKFRIDRVIIRPVAE